MESLEMIEQEEEQQLLNLSLSLVSHPYDDHNTRRKRSNDRDSSTSHGSSDGGDHQGELLRLLQFREGMLRLDHKTRSCFVDQGDRKKGLYLIHLLLKSATFLDEYNLSSAMADLTKIYQTASFTGDSVQRVAAYFADGLTAKLLKDKSPLYDMIIKDPTPFDEFLGFTHLYRVSPCYQFSHFTANQAILEAFERGLEERNNSKLHVIDFELAYGFQWPSLIQSLSEKATNTNTILSLRITGFGRSLEELVETEARLVSFSKGFENIVFEFQGLLRGSKLTHNLVRRRDNETLAVNLVVSCLHTSWCIAISDTLRSVRCLNPSITVLVQRGGGDDRRIPSFMDSLGYYAAMFESLDDCLPRESIERLCIERNCLGKEIKNAIVDDHQQPNSTLKEMMLGNGFCEMKLSSRTTMQAKLLLKMRSHCLQPQFGGFRVVEKENGKAISIKWQDRALMIVSAWQSV